MIKKNFIIIALGTNLGEKYDNLSSGIAALRHQIDILKISEIYHSEALLPAKSPQNWDNDFYNCVITGYTDLNAAELLNFCNEQEIKLAVEPRNKGSSGPRYLDIDIIAFNNDILDNKDLTIPHSKMINRAFVLFPLRDVMPNWKHPVIRLTARDLAEKIDKNQLNIKKLNLKLL